MALEPDDVPIPPLHITAIAAVAQNRVIGANGKLPWLLPADLQFFKRTTAGGVVILGRKTYESIGRPLAGRVNIIISKTWKPPNSEDEDTTGTTGTGTAEASAVPLVHERNAGTTGTLLCSADDWIAACLIAKIFQKLFNKKIFLIGGASIYEQNLHNCTDLILTHVADAPAGDTFFPPYEHLFDAGEILESHPATATTPAFEIRHHRRLH
jgi:dihydrofolate reductase